MKLSNFRIKDKLLPKIKQEGTNRMTTEESSKIHHQISPIQPMTPDQKFSLFMQTFQNFMNQFVPAAPPPPPVEEDKNDQQKSSSKAQVFRTELPKEFDHRDRYVFVDLPYFKDQKVDLDKIEAWLGQLCKEIMSVTFHYYSEGKMNYQQTKVFASECFLRNLSILVDKYHISTNEIRFIDKKLKKTILPYLQAKYPATIQKDSNKALQMAIKQIDNYHAFVNDYFYYSDITFAYRQNGRYDDLIMQLLNEIMTKLDQKSSSSDQNGEMTNYKDFQTFLTEIFEKPFDEVWMNPGDQMKLSKKSQRQREKYKTTVQQYTNFSIGRKISENTQIFTEQQIKSGSLKIKSPAILRILTKWCDQLWEKFDNQKYFMDRTEGIPLLHGKSMGVVYPWLKKLLTTKMKQEKQNIKKSLKQIQQTNYSQQIELLNFQLGLPSEFFIQKYQKVTGKFAFKVVNNIENFIVVYLNRLIHGLTKVSNSCYQQMKSFKDYWPSPYNLLSLRLGDLIRCKYSSKQKQVIKVLKEIQRISDQNPQKLKIIRIKNRLKLGTSDVQINVRFNNQINCQIQLGANSAKSQFIKYSYNFNHYIYELKRSQFGPISQMCSIWRNLQKRSVQYESIIDRQVPGRQQNIIKNSKCILNQEQHSLTDYQKPFICSQCSKHFYHDNYMVPHVYCTKCSYSKCAVCTIQKHIEAKNQDFFVKDEQLRKKCYLWQKKDKLPTTGVCVFKDKPKLETIMFRTFNYNEKNYLFYRYNDKIKLLNSMGTDEQIRQFNQSCVLYQCDKNIVMDFILKDTPYKQHQNNLTEVLMSELVIPDYIKKCLKQEKQFLSILRQDNFSKVDINSIIKEFKQQTKNIKSVEFSSTKLQNLDLLPTAFINMSHLNMSLNQVQDIQKLLEFKKLQKIYMNQNRITKLPAQINVLSQLQDINFFGNQITELPQSFMQLRNLTFLNISKNRIQILPQSISQLQNLKSLKCKGNLIKEFPAGLGKLKKIQQILLQQNQITKMPQQIQDLSQLTQLMLQNNGIQKLPQRMQKMTKLKTCHLGLNSIKQIAPIRYWKGLVNLQFNNMKNTQPVLQFGPQFSQLKNLQQLNFCDNHYKQLPESISQLKSLKRLDLRRNDIEVFPQSFDNLKNLQQLNIEYTAIKIIPQKFKNLNKLKEIKLAGCNFETIECYDFLYGVTSTQYRYVLQRWKKQNDKKKEGNNQGGQGEQTDKVNDDTKKQEQNGSFSDSSSDY